MTFFIVVLLKANTSFANWFCDGTLSNFSSPLCTDAKWVFIPGVVLTTAIFLEDKYAKRLQRYARDTRPMGQFGPLSDEIGNGYLNYGYALVNLLYGSLTNRAKALERAEHMLEATGYSVMMSGALKPAIGQKRPNGANRQSFPSNHATLAFSFASVISMQHGWKWGALAYTVAGAIGFGRLNENAHYLHDVVAGATLGISYGIGTFLNHKLNKKGYWLHFLLSPDMKGGGAGLKMGF